MNDYKDKYIIEIKRHYDVWIRRFDEPMNYEEAWEKYDKVDDDIDVESKRMIKVRYNVVAED